MSTQNKSSRSKKAKKHKLKTIATDYLSNCIQLKDSDAVKNAYFDTLIQNQYSCFLHLNLINREPTQQNEFFNYYKAKQNRENKTKSEFEKFLRNEFNETEFTSSYIDSFLSNSAIRKPRVPAINIEASNSKKPSLCDGVEMDYIKRLDHAEYNELAPSNLTLSSTPSSASINLSQSGKFSNRLNNNSKKDDHEYNNEKKLQLTGSKLNSNSNYTYQRTISESSNESNFVVLNTSTRNLGSGLNRSFNHKPTLFNNLKRLTCEKMLLTSNNSPIGVISRLPFKLNSKTELNESFISRNRHLSHSNKPIHNQTNFMIEVFELLDLDIDEYINTGSYSYAMLIDRNQKRLYDDSQNTSKDRVDFNLEDEEKYDDFDENQDIRQGPCRKESKAFTAATTYQPDYLDDPQLTEMTAGKNRTCLKFSSYAVSIIDYVKPLELKKEINETFKEKFPYIQISLTKLRSIKRELFELAKETGVDVSIIAQSYIFFEKLILQGLINKSNRKHLAANCLILAAKLNDVPKKEISKLIDAAISKFRFDNRKEMISFEFPVLVALEFNLVVRYENDFFTHYQKLLSNVESTKSFRPRTFSD